MMYLHGLIVSAVFMAFCWLVEKGGGRMTYDAQIIGIAICFVGGMLAGS